MNGTRLRFHQFKNISLDVTLLQDPMTLCFLHELHATICMDCVEYAAQRIEPVIMAVFLLKQLPIRYLFHEKKQQFEISLYFCM